MINRELIRIKIVQLTYAYYQNSGKNIDTAEKELLFSLSKSYDLYNLLLALIVALAKESLRRLEIAKARVKRGEVQEEPSQKFAFNRFALQLAENRQLQKFVATQKQSWDDEPEFVGGLLSQIENTQCYKEYVASEEDDYNTDRELWRRLYRLLIQDNDTLDALLEEKSLYWNDDRAVVDSFVLKTIKRFEEKNGAAQELLPEYNTEEEKDYALKLFRATILNADEYQKFMSDASHNWDFSRLAYMDVVIMQIAIAEMMTFPSIPLSVTINEYVELSKIYSTPKSYGYVNGMLDAIARHLVETGKLMKQLPPREEGNEMGWE